MATKSILLKVTPEVHAAIVEAALRQQRSMQSVLVSLIERWLAAGGPDPLYFDLEKRQPASTEVVDRQARQAIEALVKRVYGLQEQVTNLAALRETDRQGFDEWSEQVLADLGVNPDPRAVQWRPDSGFTKAEQRYLDRLFAKWRREEAALPSDEVPDQNSPSATADLQGMDADPGPGHRDCP